MELIKAYIFNSVEDANSFIAELDEIKGFPTEDNSTVTYCKHEEYNGVIFIRWDDFIESVIGEPPIEIQNPFINEQAI